MGRITTRIQVENLGDILLAERGFPLPEGIRSIEMDALVDTGATFLCLPSPAIAALGLLSLETRRAVTANGIVERRVHGGARLTNMGRSCALDVMELPEGTPALLGYVPLEILDLQPDPKSHCLIPNPAHGGDWILDLY